jgi:cardiolipin synthase
MGVLLGATVPRRAIRFQPRSRTGDEIFPEMLTAIRARARRSRSRTYIYWSGDIGRPSPMRLPSAPEGVALHVLLDWIGSSKMDKKSALTR